LDLRGTQLRLGVFPRAVSPRNRTQLDQFDTIAGHTVLPIMLPNPHILVDSHVTKICRDLLEMWYKIRFLSIYLEHGGQEFKPGGQEFKHGGQEFKHGGQEFKPDFNLTWLSG
jgi:hypothetical protein